MEPQNSGPNGMSMCEECGKNPACVHLTQIMNNQTTAYKLCEACAQKKGISISINESALAELGRPAAPPVPDISCSRCRLTFAEFKEKGWLGCVGCYDAFTEEIDRMLVQIHGARAHMGKRYQRRRSALRGRTDLKTLRAQLATAVKNEEFELAAQLRDAIIGRTAGESG